MGVFDAFRYDGKRVVVVGGATGMGAAAAELALDAGAESVVVMDRAAVTLPGVTAVEVDVSQPASIDAALAACGDRVDALFSCAGVAGGPGIERINFVGHRYLIEQLVATGALNRGSAICLISSTAGLGWESNFAELSELLDTTDFDAAAQWMVDHGKADYIGTKQALCAYVARECVRFLQQGIRINAVCPGPTDTPLARANADTWLTMNTDYWEATGTKASAPIEQANVVLFLCSDAASAITGISLVSDAGWASAGITGAFAPAGPIAKFLMGRVAIDQFMTPTHG